MIFIGKYVRIMYDRFFKRALDISVAMMAVVCILPFLVILLPLVYVSNKGSGLFFLQERPGKDSRIFRMIKFRTMTDDRDEAGNLLPDHMRLTPLGRFIRSTSLDELPQLINVLKGEMSLVGPRPLLPQYLPLYSMRQARRHEVRPGMTGWAQCHGRNSITWTEKLELDVWYVDNMSFGLDLRIVFETVQKVFSREGITSSGSVTADSFDGTN